MGTLFDERPSMAAAFAGIELDDGTRGRPTDYAGTKVLAGYLNQWANLARQGKAWFADVKLAELVGEYLWPEKNADERLRIIGTNEQLSIGLEMIAGDLKNPERLSVNEKRAYVKFAVLASRAFSQEPFERTSRMGLAA
jgi:hypothetical protein